MMKHYDVILVGNAMQDVFLSLDNHASHCRLDTHTNELCFRYGSKINAQEASLCIGGNAANVSVGLSRLGLKTLLFAEMGDDTFSFGVKRGLRKEKVDVSKIKQKKDTKTSLGVSLTYQDERTLFVTHVPRFHRFSFANRSASLFFLTSLGEEWKAVYKKAYLYAKKQQIPVALNPGSLQLENDKSISYIRSFLKDTSLLFVNWDEAECILFGKERKEISHTKEEAKELMQQLQQLGVKQIVMTDGTNGSYSMDETKSFYFLPSFPSPVVERTGAGDAYTSGFLSAYLNKKPFSEAMLWGSFNASAVVLEIGAQKGLLTNHAIQAKKESNPHFKVQII